MRDTKSLCFWVHDGYAGATRVLARKKKGAAGPEPHGWVASVGRWAPLSPKIKKCWLFAVSVLRIVGTNECRPLGSGRRSVVLLLM